MAVWRSVRAVLDESAPRAAAGAPPPPGAATKADTNPLVAPMLAAILALTGWALQWRGGDLAAQLHRVAIVARDGYVLWDGSWFGGHLTPGYSVLYPVLAASWGVWPVAVGSAVVAAWAFDRLVQRHIPAAGAAPGVWFAAGTVVNLAVGRMTFALGLAVGLVAILALSSRRPVVALVLTVLTPLASPVAGFFLGIAWTAHALSTRNWRVLGLAVVATAPVVLTTLLFPRGGTFPMGPGALAVTLVACVLVAWVVPPALPVIRIAAGLYALTAVAAFVVNSPLGANVTRLGMFLAWPLLVAGHRASGKPVPWRAVPTRLVTLGSSGGGVRELLASAAGRAAVVLVAAPVLLAWQWTPAIDGMTRAGADASTTAAFHEPLVQFLDAQSTGPFRVEVVPLARHGEAAFVADHHLLARGWDRQLDRLNHAVFYEGTLTEESYRTWLATEGVRFVALANAELDGAGKSEAELLRAGLEGLRLVLTTPSWRVWEVIGETHLTEGPGHLLSVGSDQVVVRAEMAGLILVKVRAPGRWKVQGPACLLESSADGWLRLQASGAGRIELEPAGLALAGPGCDDTAGALGHQPRRSISQVSSTSSPRTT